MQHRQNKRIKTQNQSTDPDGAKDTVVRTSPEEVVFSLLFSCYVLLFVTLWIAACQASLSFTISQSLLTLRSIELVILSNHLILCLLFLPSIFPSIRVFFNKSALPIRWPKYWSFSSSVSHSSEYSGLISFRIDWFDLLAVHGTLKNLFQCPSSKASFLLHSELSLWSNSHIHT